ncbi:hypothetical protein EV421DRAFT_1937318 [Armillaria borealis]|uniref:Uncharacterized protein n=1 Tax=Armillaria borealis TaxID=47425 RepID=A0AA39JMP9_9AGAR|nr:hypothetical protein EV421DRAFT_1937318 [Armillaria borealis]
MDRLSRHLVATFLNSLPQTRSRRWSHTSSITPIQAFFARYPMFSYDSSKETMAQFHGMASQLSKISLALVQQFNEMYGGDANDLHDWKRLCEVVSRREIVPNDIDACKAVIKNVHVNICDLVDHKVPLPIHDTETALSEYTCRSDYKIFPRGAAVGHEMLRLFLRNIFDPSREREKSSTKSGEGEENGTGESK